MPIYEYRCNACQHEFETIQKVGEAPPPECPACGEGALRKKVTAAGFRLKGGGWYETDFKSGKKKNVTSGDTSSSSSGDGESSSTSSDSSDAKSSTSTKDSSKGKSGGTSAASD
jgi:putative FmdB family regulatory protein